MVIGQSGKKKMYLFFFSPENSFISKSYVGVTCSRWFSTLAAIQNHPKPRLPSGCRLFSTPQVTRMKNFIILLRVIKLLLRLKSKYKTFLQPSL